MDDNQDECLFLIVHFCQIDIAACSSVVERPAERRERDRQSVDHLLFPVLNEKVVP